MADRPRRVPFTVFSSVTRQRRRVFLYIASFVGVIVLYTVAYMWGMATFQGETRTVLQAFSIVVETFTTTGYGVDAGQWTTPQMRLLMVLMQMSGVILIFMALPVFVAPWVQEALRVSPPTTIDDDVENHVVICGYSPRAETLIDEFHSWDHEYVVVVRDRDAALDLYEQDITVVHGDPESADALRNVHVEDADAVIADATDEQNASIALAVREVSETVRVISLVENPDLTNYLQYAGADQVFSPRHLLGHSLAEKVTASVTTDLGETVTIGEDFEILELSIQAGSDIDGTRLDESGVRERTGANIIGLWRRGEFQSSPSPTTELDGDTILLAAGRETQLERLKEMTISDGRGPVRSSILVAGYGEVGSTVEETMQSKSVRTTVVDREEKPGVDVLGDVTDEDVLREAGIEYANALILALADDTTTIFATLIARELAPGVEIVARANETDNIGKLYSAGADYVLALETVSGRMLASTILEGEEIISPDKQIEILRTTAPRLTGQTLRDAAVRTRTGCTVIAVERNGEVITDLGPDFVVRGGDQLIIAGTDEDTNEFAEIAQ
ncbi:TrkA-N domain protein [Haladaptatus paucihalophilus DX253]|uniref:Trk K+ transport system, NAD-binding component n=1 Tax=Haladaptatus paucihalophilus DX253 TaxID=797209 RepID=E7QPR9_HALPU|nr:NAD-binding protein [Haladaptatus paucihalophilus]EFW93522.1 TrkA-N domain protein [Haladaptatus paucihalophilus DX253]SHL21365.1 Trk K+ transport system, NAD-binding component [Haladaptatus paucihalophilus DX253]